MSEFSPKEKETLSWALRVAQGLEESTKYSLWVISNADNVQYRIKYDRLKAKHSELIEHIKILKELVGKNNVRI